MDVWDDTRSDIRATQVGYLTKPSLNAWESV